MRDIIYNKQAHDKQARRVLHTSILIVSINNSDRDYLPICQGAIDQPDFFRHKTDSKKSKNVKLITALRQ